MSIKVSCSCGAEFKAKDELAGKRLKCPSCAQPFTVPNSTLTSLPATSAGSVARAEPVAGGTGQAGIGVWYASEERVLSTSKVLVFDDKGVLRAAKNGFSFDGQRQQMCLSDIQQVSLVTQQFPWMVYLAINVALVVVFALQVTIAAARGELAGIGQVLPQLGGSLVVLLLINAFGLFVGWQTKWIRIDHRDESGHLLVSFFADSSAMGWGGIFGGTRLLYEKLSSAHLGEPSRPGPPVSETGELRDTLHPNRSATSGIPTTSVWAVISLILGVLSIPVLCCFFPAFATSPAAIVTGHIARYVVRQSDGKKTGAGLALIGLVLGYGVLAVLISFVVLGIIGPIEFDIPARRLDAK